MNTAPAAPHVRDMWFEMLDQSVAHYVTDTVSEVYPMTADGPRFVRVREDDGTIQLTALTNDRAELICSEVTVSGAATSPAALATIIEAML